MTFDELKGEVRSIRAENILSPAEEEMIPILLELIEAVESLSARVQELALDRQDSSQRTATAQK